ncbi:MAG: sulfurtransferase complex subunit TusC [Thermoleophilia bacterium]
MGEDEKIEKLMIVFRTAPYGTIYAFEGLENVLIMGAYDQDISVLFVDDGVYAIKEGMNTEATGIKNFSPTFRALEAYDIEKIYIDKDSLESRGLSVDDLVIEPQVIEAAAVAEMMEEQKNFFIF